MYTQHEHIYKSILEMKGEEKKAFFCLFDRFFNVCWEKADVKYKFLRKQIRRTQPYSKCHANTRAGHVKNITANNCT